MNIKCIINPFHMPRISFIRSSVALIEFPLSLLVQHKEIPQLKEPHLSQFAYNLDNPKHQTSCVHCTNIRKQYSNGLKSIQIKGKNISFVIHVDDLTGIFP
jgi:hypothetical protein